MERNAPKFIVVDGLTGSGKSTIIRAVKDWVFKNELRAFDLAEWTQEHSVPPRFADIADYDVYFTFEPTKQWVGAAIRYEMSQTEQPYSGIETAQAFSLDRLIMYRRLIEPALRANKIIVQDRSVTSSLAIQPVLPNGPTLEELLALPGNANAIEHAMTDLILTEIPAKLAHERLGIRTGESKGIFENLDLLKTVEERYKSDWFRTIFTERGTTIHTIDTSTTIEEGQQNAKQLIKSILNA